MFVQSRSGQAVRCALAAAGVIGSACGGARHAQELPSADASAQVSGSGSGESSAGSGSMPAAGSDMQAPPLAGRAASVAGSAAANGGARAVAPASAATDGAAGQAPGTDTAKCSREDLKAQVAGYFAALAAHDPSMLPQGAGLKFTENAMQLQLGEGLMWKTAAAAKLTRSLYDAERCGTVTEAVVPNSGTDTIYGLRLQVVDRELTEIESIVVDPDDGFYPMPMGILNSKAEVWEDVLPVDQRSTRLQLEAAGKAYFDWFGDSSVMPPSAMPCDRLENGFKTTQGRCDNLGGAMGIKHPAQRYPYSDLEAGITAGFVLFAGADLDFHMFKVVGGRIQRINAVVGPAVRSSGW